MLTSFEYEIVNKEYIRCLKLINTYNQRGQKCIIFSLRSFECLINKTMYNTVFNSVADQLRKDNYDVITHNREMLILWDKRDDIIGKKINEERETKIIEKQLNKKIKKKDKDITLNHISIKFGDYIDSFPIKTGIY